MSQETDIKERTDIEVSEHNAPGYAPVIDYETWRVAMLNCDGTPDMSGFDSMQKHLLSDEVFVLLKGSCTLYTGGAGEEIDKLQAMKMEPYKCYNVKAGVWHAHTLEPGTMVLIVENRNTNGTNSPRLSLTDEQLAQLQTL